MKLVVNLLHDASLRTTELNYKGVKVLRHYDGDGALYKVTLDGARSKLPNLSELLNIVYPREQIVTVRGLNWFDRNPKNVGEQYDDSVAPHATTDRITYKVPAQRICMVEAITTNAARTSAAGGNAWVNIRWLCTPRGGTKRRIITYTMYGNTIGELINDSLGTGITLFDGDILTMETTQAGVGGTVSYECAFKGTEFDI